MGRALVNTIAAAAVAVGVFVATGGNIAAAQAAFLVTSGALNIINRGKAPKPDTTQSAQKQPVPIRVRAYGRSRLRAYYAYYGNGTNGTAVSVWAYMDGQADGVERVYLNDEQVTISGGVVQALPDKKYQGGNVRAGYTLGSLTNTAFSAVMSVLPGKWTVNHRGDGVVTGYLILNPEKDKYYLETYPQGDQVEMSLVARWQPCFDPRDGVTRWTENPVLHTLDYLVRIRGYDYAKRFLPTVQYWIDAANICDQPVPLKSGGTEPRYRGCVSYSANAAEKEVLASLLETFDGWTQERGDGAFVIYAGRVYTPTVTIGPDEIINSNVQNFVEAENEIDQVKVTYISADHDFNEVETTPWGGENGATRIGTVDAQSPSYSQNRRLAKRLMARTNAPQRGSISTNLLGRKIRGQRYIYLNDVEISYDAYGQQVVVVAYQGIAEITSVKRDFQNGGLTFEWIAADQNIDSWNPATEEGEPAAKEDRVATLPVDTPAVSSVSVIYDGSADEGTGARLSIFASGSDAADNTWYARWKRSEASVWNENTYPDQDPTGGVTLVTGFVPVNASVDVQVQYRRGDGRVSDWSPTYTISTSTSDTPPDAATAITLVTWSDTLDLITDFIPRASNYRWRFYAQDGTTLIRTLTTSGRSVSYTSQQAQADGPRRSYIVRVAGVNGAGAGDEASTATITLAAPPKVTGVDATGGESNATVVFDEQTAAVGYSVAYSSAANFDPLTQGAILIRYASPAYLQNLATGTFYVKVAAYDAWTNKPDLLNYSDEDSFVITTGGGGTGGGGGAGGGGYCVRIDTMILMSGGDHKAAGEIVAGDMVWTQHEDTKQWGAFEVSDVAIIDCDDMYYVPLGTGFYASSDHKIWISGSWVKASEIGTPAESGKVVAMNVVDAHTYISAGVLSHNANGKQAQN